MSFATEIKNELCKNESDKNQLRLLCMGAVFAMNEDGEKLSFRTECKKAADYIEQAMLQIKLPCRKSVFDIRGKTLYSVELSKASVVGGIPDCSDDDAFGIFLRGVFLVCGGAGDPEKGYQLEIFLHDEDKCRRLLSMIEEHGMTAKLSTRRGSSFLYIKESEKISDILTFMGAMMQAMEIMNIKIYKEVRNNVNRSVNCESANLDKTVAAANIQADDIEYIFAVKGRGYLSEELLKVADIRLENRELSLSDIGAMLEPPISRSGVNHRFRKISEIAKKLRAEDSAEE
ncbi:MAG: DNA-binding protein WhiA [Ruminiclostridium sp.]|nr:DNA-binding protein WhiA [Ruminiclostridium sp.]